MKYHFYSDFDCIVKIENAGIKVFAGTKTTCKVSEKIDFAEVIPLNNKGLLPYCFTFNDDSGLINCLKVNDDNYIVTLHCNYPKVYSILASLSTLSADYEVVGDEKIKITSGQSVILEKKFDCINAELYQKNNLIFCVLNGHKDKLLVVLDEQNNVVVDDKISQIEHLSNGFQTLINLNDMQKQGVVKKYEIDDSGVQKTGEYAVYINHSAKELYSQKFVPLAFFEAVKAGNITLAKTYLSGSLAMSITSAHIKAYFGDFDYLYDVSDICNFPSVCLYSSKNNSCLLCKMLVVANKIENIQKM